MSFEHHWIDDSFELLLNILWSPEEFFGNYSDQHKMKHTGSTKPTLPGDQNSSHPQFLTRQCCIARADSISMIQKIENFYFELSSTSEKILLTSGHLHQHKTVSKPFWRHIRVRPSSTYHLNIVKSLLSLTEDHEERNLGILWRDVGGKKAKAKASQCLREKKLDGISPQSKGGVFHLISSIVHQFRMMWMFLFSAFLMILIELKTSSLI